MRDDPIDETRSFLSAARRYCAYIEQTEKTDTEFLEELEHVLLDLYTLATTLRQPMLQHDENYDNSEDFGEVLSRLDGKLGSNRYYWEVFDPFDHEDHQPVCGDLVDDLADIYKDIKRGLTVFDIGTPASRETASWELWYGFKSHWGRHAISASKAIHFLLGRS